MKMPDSTFSSPSSLDQQQISALISQARKFQQQNKLKSYLEELSQSSHRSQPIRRNQLSGHENSLTPVRPIDKLLSQFSQSQPKTKFPEHFFDDQSMPTPEVPRQRKSQLSEYLNCLSQSSQSQNSQSLPNPLMLGFKTGNNKEVIVTQESISQAKAFLIQFSPASQRKQTKHKPSLRAEPAQTSRRDRIFRILDDE